MKFNEWIKLRELMTQPQAQGVKPPSAATAAQSAGDQKDTDEIRTIASKSKGNKQLADNITKYFKKKLSNTRDPLDVVKATAAMNTIVGVIPK